MRGATVPDDHRTQLLLRAQQGDSQAFCDLYAAMRPVVADYAASLNSGLSAHEHDDLVQEVFLRAWRGLGAYRGQASAKTYYLSLTRNTLYEMRRRARRDRAAMTAMPARADDLGCYTYLS